MTIFTFKTDEVPEFIYIDRERFRVGPFRERPLQCFKCFAFGHSSKKCTGEQKCATCSLEKLEGECLGPVLCLNCNGNHSARYKECAAYKKEMAAVEKAHAEHLSIGHAKRLLYTKSQYSEVVKGGSSGKEQSKKPNQVHKPQLSPSQLEIHSASQPSSQKAPLPLHQGASQASLEASQAESLPDLGSSQTTTLISKNHKAEVHGVEMEPQRPKRPLSPSPPPAKSSNHGGKIRSPRRVSSRSHEDLSASSSTKQRPNIFRLAKHVSGIQKKRFNL